MSETISPDPALAPSAGRLKRQVQGRSHQFALVCPPGLEDICLAEARALGLELSADAVPGPVLAWSGRLEDLYRASLFLRTASRILVRLTSFRAGAREELFRHVADFPWELWLPAGAALRVDAHVRHSRISHEGMTATTVFEAVARRFRLAGLVEPRLAGAAANHEAAADILDDEADQPVGADAAVVQRLIVRLEDNRASLSLDASGEHLHRRGWRTEQGAAPIRENLAAGLLAWTGWPGRYTNLVDGMTGSGTLAIEALAAAGGGSTCGAAERDFAYRHWPSFMAARLDWLRRQTIPRPVDSNQTPGMASQILANELDPAVLIIAQANGRRFQGPTAVPGIEWRQGDFFDLNPPVTKGLLVLNPPYGLRLSDGQGSLYPRICRCLDEKWRSWDILLLGLPETGLGPLAASVTERRIIRHGGLKLAAWLIRG